MYALGYALFAQYPLRQYAHDCAPLLLRILEDGRVYHVVHDVGDHLLIDVVAYHVDLAL